MAADVWARSLDDRFTDYQTWVSSGEAEGYVWGVKWQGLYPGMQLLPQTAETQEWSARLGLLFHEALIETNGHNISLVFSGLTVTTVAPGHAPFVVPASGPDSSFRSSNALTCRVPRARADERMTVGHAVGMESVTIKDGRTALVFSDPDAVMTVPAQYLSVTIEGPDLRASRQVYEGYDEGFSSLAGYFADLAANWRGWNGSRSYESIEGDLRIQANHDGHVHLHVALWESTVPEGWRVEAEVRLDAGEVLTTAARDVAALVRARLA